MIFKNQNQMFNWIWDNRPHVSELSGEKLLPKGHFKWHWQFLHVLPKGSYPSMKLDPNNILLGLPDEHDKQDQYPVFVEKRQQMTKEYHEKQRKFSYQT